MEHERDEDRDPDEREATELEWVPGQLVMEHDGRIRVRCNTRAEAKLAIREVKLKKKELQLGRREVVKEIQQVRAGYRSVVAGRYSTVGFGRGTSGRLLRAGIQGKRRAERMSVDDMVTELEAERDSQDAAILGSGPIDPHAGEVRRGKRGLASAMAPLAGMSKYWTSASAMLPQAGGWEIRGVVKGPRQADPAIHGSSWTAWAAGDGQRVEGHGDTAEDAMQDLANKLRGIRVDPNG